MNNLNRKIKLLESENERLKKDTQFKEGWLVKQGHIFRNWKKRWFLLLAMNKDARLFYSETPGGNFKGVILLKGGRSLFPARYWN